MKKWGLFFVCLFLFVSLFSISAFSKNTNDKLLFELNGTWEGSFPVDIKNEKDKGESVIINFVNGEKPKLLLTFENSGLYY